MKVNLTLLLALACGLLLSSCGVSAPPPAGAITQAELAVTQATANGAEELAPSSLRLAREKLVAAKQAMASQDYLAAGRLAEQAQVDAQAAEAHAMMQNARHDDADMRSSIDTLRRELARPLDTTN